MELVTEESGHGALAARASPQDLLLRAEQIPRQLRGRERTRYDNNCLQGHIDEESPRVDRISRTLSADAH